MSKKEKYGFYLLKAQNNSVDAVRTAEPKFAIEQLQTLTSSRCIDIVQTWDFNDLADFDGLTLVVDDEGAISGKKYVNELASFMYGQAVFGDVVLCRSKRYKREEPDIYPFDLSERQDAVDFFRLSQILPSYAEFLYALKDYPTDDDLHDIFGLPLPWDDE